MKKTESGLPYYESEDAVELDSYTKELTEGIDKLKRVKDIESIKTEGLIDYYKIIYQDGTTKEIQVKNGSTELLNVYVNDNFELVVENSKNINVSIDDEFNLIIDF